MRWADSVRKVQVMRTVLSAALTRAVREELISHNVARLVELPEWRPEKVRPWTVDEARQFLATCKPDPLYAAFVLLLLYGLRRGEVLGIRWQGIDFGAGVIHIEQQVQRVGGELHVGPVKPMPGTVRFPARDAQIILGHSRLAVTLEIYTHADDEAQLDALTRLHDLFDQDEEQEEDEAEG